VFIEALSGNGLFRLSGVMPQVAQGQLRKSAKNKYYSLLQSILPLSANGNYS
jgi:hypothetical protein